MNILALSDEVVPVIYGANIRVRYANTDLIVSCGDLPPTYLEFVVSMLNVPLLYVPGNHDADDLHVRGGQSVDGRVVRIKGLTIAGLGGSRRYKRQGRNQYSEVEMYWRVAKLAVKLLLQRALTRRKLDLFITHAPPFGIHDGKDLAHIGFKAFRWLIHLFKPAWMLHGHTHLIRNITTTVSEMSGCKIVNVYPFRTVETLENA
jgi:Icc-related predicted phosphoesterase